MTLTPERLPAVRALFEAALDLPPEERAAFLSTADPTLRDEVASLVAAADQTPVDFSRPLAQHFDLRRAPAGAGPLVGRLLGPYRVLRELGHGGMGTVYEAERADDQFTKRVAIKTVRSGADSAELLRRFQREREIQAGLQHPNIATVLDAGVTEDGVPYLVLELVDGLPIDAYCDQHRLGLHARLDLFRQVIGAVHHAHRQLVVHRDLKPSNILVTGDGVVKLLDFGISKLIDDSGEHTATEGARAFTTAYASPEQVRGDPIGTATDIYSLGVVLYRLLTGRNPLPVDQVAPAAAWRLICEQDPEPPSRGVTPEAAAAMGLGGQGRLARELAGDLDAIVLMTLRKEPDRRYPTADALGEDLLRHLRGLPVQARPDTTAYRWRRLVARNRWAAVGVGVAVLAMVAGTTVSLWQARQAREQTALADAERLTAQGVSRFLQEIFASADPSFAGRGLGVDATIGEAIDLAAGRIDTDLADQPAVAEELHRRMVSIYGARQRMTEGKLHAQRVLELQRDRGAPGPVVARTLRDLAELYRLEGRADSTAALLQEAYGLFQDAGEPETEDFAMVLNDIAIGAWARGDFAGAETVVVRALAIAEKAGSEDRLLAVGHSNLGVMREHLGNTEGAEIAFRRAESLHDRSAAGDSYERGTNLHNLAGLLATKGDLRDAESVMVTALDTWGRTVGEGHPILGVGRFTLARIQTGLGRPIEALATIDTADRLIAAFGPNHPDRARGEVQRAVALLALGRLPEAERHARRGLELRQVAFGPSDVRVAEAELTLGRVLVARGDLAAGREMLARSAASFRSTFGPDHPRTRDTEHALRTILQR